MVKPVDGGAEGALGREGADVQFIEDRLLPRAAAPIRIAPSMGSGVDHLARPMHVLGLVAGGRVGHAQPVREGETVASAGARMVRYQLMPAPVGGPHRYRIRTIQLQANL